MEPLQGVDYYLELLDKQVEMLLLCISEKISHTGKRRAWWPWAESRRQGGCSSWEEVGIHTTGKVRNSGPDAAEQ